MMMYSPFMPLGGPEGAGGSLGADAKSGSSGWAPRLARTSAPMLPVQKGTMDWRKAEPISSIADVQQQQQGKKKHQAEVNKDS